MATMTFGHTMLEHWPLERETTYLNHGTVGVPPKRVLAAQQAIRDQIERQPARFLLRELTAVRVGGPRTEPPRLRVAADAVAAFLGARGEDLAFVDNASTGVSTVLQFLGLESGDEIVRFDQAYGGVVRAAEHVARTRGARVRVVDLPDPPSPAAIVDAFAAALGPSTRLALIDHVTSESAIVIPVAAIAERCRARGVPVLVDGAHAPGAIALDIPALGVDWYTGNLHKWAWSPRSCAILWVSPERQAGLHPLVVSWGLDQGFTTEFDAIGTRDPSAALASPEGIAYMRELGVEAVRSANHALAWEAGQLLCDRWGTPQNRIEEQIGTMISVPLPESFGATAEAAARLRDALLFEDHIEVQVHPSKGRLWIRVSAQIYNQRSDLEQLGEAVSARR